MQILADRTRDWIVASWEEKYPDWEAHDGSSAGIDEVEISSPIPIPYRTVLRTVGAGGRSRWRPPALERAPGAGRKSRWGGGEVEADSGWHILDAATDAGEVSVVEGWAPSRRLGDRCERTALAAR